jgi:hypothetical protein
MEYVFRCDRCADCSVSWNAFAEVLRAITPADCRARARSFLCDAKSARITFHGTCPRRTLGKGSINITVDITPNMN